MGVWKDLIGEIMGGKNRGKAINNYYGGEYWQGNNHTNYSNPMSSCDKSMPAIDEITDKTIEKFESYGVVVIEKLKGTPVRIATDGKEIKYMSRYTEVKTEHESFGAIKILKKYKELIMELQKEIGVPVCVYGEMVGKNISADILYRKDDEEKVVFFYDICLNDNWMNWDDFEELTRKHKIPIVPFLGKITYDVEKLKKYLEKNSLASEFSDQPMEGIVIRPIIEDSDYSRRLMVKMTNEKFKPKPYYSPSYQEAWKKPETTLNTPAVVEPFGIPSSANQATLPFKTQEEVKEHIKKSEELMAEIHAEKILDEFANDARVIFWNNELECANIEIKDENAIRIITHLTMNCIKDLQFKIRSIAKVQNIPEDLLKKEIKRELPKRILKILNIKIPSKEE